MRPAISADGRFVAFHSDATNLVAGDTNGATDVFVHDLQTGTTERVSVDSAGDEANAGSDRPSIDADGGFVAFESSASNLVAGDTNDAPDVFVHERGPSVDSASQDAPAAGTVSTNTSTSPDDPVGASVTTPLAGTVTIDEVAATTPDPSGYSLLGQEVQITAPSASAADPLVLEFRLDASVLPPGADETTAQAFRDGAPIADCDAGAGSSAAPDPCVAARTATPGGGVELTVRTSQASTWNFGVTLDATPPETTIDSGPSGPTNDASPSFGFSSDDPGASFECRLDSNQEADFQPCSSPQAYSSLTDGLHTFEVRATNTEGTDPTPASRSFTVDTAPPETAIDSGPSGPTNQASPSFSFSSEPGTSFECRLDSAQEADFQPCSSPQSYSSLTDGSHSFEVRATDSVGNTDPTPASRSFTVDTAPPETAIDSGPSGPTNQASPSFSFSSEPGTSFECRLDSAQEVDFQPCSSPQSYGSLTNGSHTFEVRATDSVGNTDPTPASRSFTVDTTAPQTQITGPSGPIHDPTPSFGFSSEAGASFKCKVDSGAYLACTSPITTRHLTDGSHAFYVRATDSVGNTDPTPAQRMFTVRTAAVSVSGSTLVVTAAAGAKDNFAVTHPSGPNLRVTDTPGATYTGSGVHTGAGCTRSGDYSANCHASGITLIKVSSGDQNDKVVIPAPIKSSLDGGAANDTLQGSPKDDTLTGGPGADVLKGMNGNDQLLVRDNTDDATINCDGGTRAATADKAVLDSPPNDSPATGCEKQTRPSPYVALGDSLSNGYISQSQTSSIGFVRRLYGDYKALLHADQLFDEAEDGASTTTLRNDGQLAAGLADINAASDTKAVTIEIGGAEAFLGGPCPGHWDQPAVCPVRANLAYIFGKLKTALAGDPGPERFTAMAYYNPNSGIGGSQEVSIDKALLGNNLKMGCSDSGQGVGLNDLIYQEAGKLGIPVANPYAAFKQHGQAYMSQTDSLHIHPNDTGYAAIAQIFRNAGRPCG